MNKHLHRSESDRNAASRPQSDAMLAMLLPPLNAVRAFEASGRNLSFKKAAAELSVTLGAVSRQIRLLEDFIGMPLFIRETRRVALTDVGKDYLAKVTDSLYTLSTATEQLMAVSETAPLRIASSSTFTLQWLMPRLMSFYAANPGQKLQLSLNWDTEDLWGENLDAMIRLGHETTPRAVVRQLFRTDLVPVCSPRLLASGPPLRSISDLEQHTLLHSTLRPHAWSHWLAGAGHSLVTGKFRLEFEGSSLTFQAAKEGVGIAMGQVPLLLQELRSGALTIPFPQAVPDIENFNFLSPDPPRKSSAFASFRKWLLAQAQETEAEIEELLSQLTRP